MTNFGFLSSHPASTLRALLLLAALLPALAVQSVPAQSQATEGVHIVPAKKAAAEPVPASGTEASTSLNVHSKPFHANVDLVLVPVTVTDYMNRPLVGLSRADFSIFEDGTRQQIRSFWSDDSPISVGVLLDVSKSMTNKLDVAQRGRNRLRCRRAGAPWCRSG